MILRSFADLVFDLDKRRTVGDKPPVLLLGAGASIDAGIGAMPELFEFLGCADFDAFCEYIDTTTAAERYRYLADFLQTRRPGEVSPGYRALATLCAQNYFDLVLTTNLDPLLEDALAAARLWRRDYLLIVNGVIRPDRVSPLLSGQSPRVKIVKLHGDLFQRFMAWTVPEMDTFLTEISPTLKPAIANRDFIVVGYSLRDHRVRELVESSGGSVWFTHPQAVPNHLEDNKSIRAVIAPECAFENFFPSLAKALQVALPKERLDAANLQLYSASPVGAEAQTMDDLMSATLAIAGPDDAATSTAFLIAEPRVILCDRFASNPHIVDGAVDVIASDGQRFSTHVIGTDTKHVFGPIVLETPDALRVPGLRIAGGGLQKNATVQILVAAGAKTGISTGKVTNPRLGGTHIAPIASKVPDLAELECYVAGGASGAPVVDAMLSVCGFIVAGDTNPHNRRSMAYPAQHWAPFLRSDRFRQPNPIGE